MVKEMAPRVAVGTSDPAGSTAGRGALIRDIAVVIIATILFFFFAVAFDLRERFTKWTMGGEGWEADELIFAAVAFGISSAWFGYRRRQALQLVLTQSKRKEKTLRKAHDELEMRVQERTANLTSANVQLQREIRERKQAEEAIRESEERARSIIDTAYDAFISIDVLSVMTDWNRQAEVMFGWSREEAVGRRLTDTIIPPQLREAHERGLKHFLATGESQILSERVQLTAVHRDGHEFPVELAVWAVPSGDSYTFNAFVQDITQRKRAEELLRESEERFRQLAENVAEVSWLIDYKGDRVLYVSPAYEKIWGRTCKSLYDEPSSWLDAVHPEDRERMWAANERMLDHGELDQEYRVVQPDGTVRYVWDRGFPLRDELGEVYRLAGVVVDITERKRAEEALRVAREELEGRVERQMLRRNPYGLTFRELTVLHLVAAGKTAKEIGSELGISPLTAQKHISNILTKMDAASRTEAVARGLREGLLD